MIFSFAELSRRRRWQITLIFISPPLLFSPFFAYADAVSAFASAIFLRHYFRLLTLFSLMPLR